MNLKRTTLQRIQNDLLSLTGRQKAWTNPVREHRERPVLAQNVQLVGEMQGSGFEDRQWLIERDGQFIQLTELLYRVLEQINGVRTLEEIAMRVTEFTDWIVSADNVRQIVQTKLIPRGLVVTADGAVAAHTSRRVPLAIRSVKVLGPGIIDPTTRVLQFLYWPPIFIALLILIVVAHVWLYFIHGVTDSIRYTLYTPGELLLVLLIEFASIAFHEFGHAAALRYGGGKVRGMGAGVYIVYPIFYTDTTDSYRLGRWARVRTDIGGFYFQFIFTLVTTALYFVTQQEFYLAILVLVDVQLLYECNPLVRFDGYWTLADLTGIPDLFSHLGPFLLSISSKTSPFLRRILRIPPSAKSKVSNLKPLVKVVYICYIIAVTFGLPILLFFLLMYEPTILSTTWTALLSQRAAFTQAKINSDLTIMLLAILQTFLLALPLYGDVYLVYSLAKKGWNWSKVTMKRAITGAVFAAACIALLVFLWIPQLPSFASGGALAAGGVGFKPVDGIPCAQTMYAAEHIHVHLSIYVNGQAVVIPASIGIPPGGNCFYWLHTHQFDGVIHVEAPTKRTFSLGQFFDIWSQGTQASALTDSSFLGYPLQGHQLVIWVSSNGQAPERYIPSFEANQQQLLGCSAANRCYIGILQNLVLQSHQLITIAYDSPHITPIQYFNWGASSAGG